MSIIGAAGLAQNFSAIKSLITSDSSWTHENAFNKYFKFTRC